MRIAAVGRSELLYATVERLVAAGHNIAVIVTAKEAPEYTRTAEDFQSLAMRLGCPFIRTARIAERIPELVALGPMDLAVSVNYSGIIPQAVLDVFAGGVLNAHGGDLPRYRGNACHAWAILNGEARAGLCIHRMIGGELDSGDIICREYHRIAADTRVTELWQWMCGRIPHLFEQAAETLAADPGFVLERQSRDPRDALRCYPRQPSDGRIDWQRSAVDILRLINASAHPYAGAFFRSGNETLTVWSAAVVEDGEQFLAVPGQVTAVTGEWLQVATGAGKIQLNEIRTIAGQHVVPNVLVASLRTRLS